mgnify:CR=1 FL=1
MTTRLSAADRKRPTLWDLLVAVLVAGIAVALFFSLREESGNFLSARVVLDGETIAQYNLTTLTEPITLEVDAASYPLTIQAEPGRICILESSCPGQDCVHTGWASRAGQQIICLPNRLVISLEGGTSEGIDAVTG